MHVILMGPQGSGKGTQATRLAPRLGLTLVATGELFRAAIAAATPLGQRIKAAYDCGELISDDITIALVEEKLDGIARERALGEAVSGALYDGFPRTRGQAVSLDDALTRRGEAISAVVQIEVPIARLVDRLAGRRVCKNCGAVYHVEFNPPRQDDLCDTCGGPLIQREDDTPSAVRKRLDLYFAQTAPLIDYYRARGLVTTVDGDRPIAEVTDAIIAAIAHLSTAGS